MSYIEPRKIMAMLNNPHRLNEVLHDQRTLINHALKYLEMVYSGRARLNTTLLVKVSEFLKANIGLDIPLNIIASMFMLYPLESCIVNDTSSPESRNAILDMISHFYLNSTYPSIDDCIDDEEWCEALKRGAEYLLESSYY